MQKYLAGLALVGLTIVGFAAPASASGPPTNAQGSFVFTSDDQEVTQAAGGNTFFSEVGIIDSAGGVAGSLQDTDVFVFHANGSFEGHGIETCSCSIGGRTGSYVAVFDFQGSGDNYVGELSFISGTGGLLGIHGGGRFTGLAFEGTGTYSYRYLFS